MIMSKKNEISNFIKKSEKVYILSKEDSLISHDIPFEDNYSDSIKIKIEAKSPIFIRNHYQEGDDNYEVEKDGEKIKISKEFCHYNKIPYIPASSIKGMIRNSVEIISYGRLKGKTLDEYLEDRIKDSSSLHKSDSIDLSDAIFGTTELKGRVQFSHFNESSQPTLQENPYNMGFHSKISKNSVLHF